MRALLSLATAVALCVSVSARALIFLPDDQYKHYVTEPRVRFIKQKAIAEPEDRSRLAPGYMFISPFFHKVPIDGYGPQIVDQDGDLVWWGNDTANNRAQNFQPCRFDSGKLDHLCYSEGNMVKDNYMEGLNRVLDQSYKDIGKSYYQAKYLDAPNPHEFTSNADGKTFMDVVYHLTAKDLRPYNGSDPGFVFDGCFQEINFDTNDVEFKWCGLDHLYEWESYIFLDSVHNVANHTGEPYGNGSLAYPWDYFHINSAEKMPDGDYLISARHLNQVLKIAGNNNSNKAAPGSILWRLGGKFNMFNGSEKADLSRQHHVRVLDSNATHTRISLFNNQWQVGPGSKDRRISNVQIIVLNTETMAVEHVQKFFHPEGHVSVAQGSAQVLPNGNMLAGWGTVPHYSEYAPDGTLLQHMHMAPFSDNALLDDTQNYRTFKFEWVGKPDWDPKMVAYSQSCNDGQAAPLVAHVSWNGATEVKTWRFSTSHARNGPWFAAGTFPKTGFETKAHLAGGAWGGNATFARFVKVEALDSSGRAMRSVVSETFVPAAEIADKCDQESCSTQIAWFEYEAKYGRQATCRSAGRPGAVLVTLALVAAAVTATVIAIKRWRSGSRIFGGGLPLWMPKDTVLVIDEKMAMLDPVWMGQRSNHFLSGARRIVVRTVEFAYSQVNKMRG